MVGQSLRESHQLAPALGPTKPWGEVPRRGVNPQAARAGPRDAERALAGPRSGRSVQLVTEPVGHKPGHYLPGRDRAAVAQ